MVLDSYTDPEFIVLTADVVGTDPDGPPWQALQERRTIVADDFSTETRWPGFVRILVNESPVSSAVVVSAGFGRPRSRRLGGLRPSAVLLRPVGGGPRLGIRRLLAIGHGERQPAGPDLPPEDCGELPPAYRGRGRNLDGAE